MDVAICIGGTGARCFEAFLYSVAAGQVPSLKRLHVMVIDKDGTCKTVALCKAAIDKYNAMRKEVELTGDAQKFAQAEILLAEGTNGWNFDEVLRQLTNGQTVHNMRDAFSITADNSLLSAMYSNDEQTTPLTKGFYGHPSIGASLYRHATETNALYAANPHPIPLLADVRRELQLHNTVRVFFFGSVFGGTGAAVMPNIARAIKRLDAQRVAVSGALMLPYFYVPPPAGQNVNPENKLEKIDSIEYIPKTVTALRFYDRAGVVAQSADASGCAFDSLYIMGLWPLAHTTDTYCDGGSDQWSHKHFVDYYAACAACDFFSTGFSQKKTGVFIPQLFTDRPGDNIGARTIRTEDQHALHNMLRFSAAVIQYVHMPFVRHADNDDALTKRFNFTLAMFKDKANEGAEQDRANQNEQFRQSVSAVFSFCREFLTFIRDLCESNVDHQTPPQEGKYTSRLGDHPGFTLFDESMVRELFMYADMLVDTDQARSLERDKWIPPTPRLDKLSGDAKISMLSLRDIDTAFAQASFNGELKKMWNDLFQLCKIV